MRKLVVRGLTALVLLAVIGNLRGLNAGDSGARTVEDFRLEGVAIWQCQCPAYGCPCQQNGLPRMECVTRAILLTSRVDATEKSVWMV